MVGQVVVSDASTLEKLEGNCTYQWGAPSTRHVTVSYLRARASALTIYILATGHHSTFLSLPMDADYLLHKILRCLASRAVYNFFTEVRVISRWGECASKWSHHSVRGPFSSLVMSTMRLAIACRTATHHNMMLDPCVLCASSRFVIIALITLIDTMQPRLFLICAYCTIGAKVRPPFLPCQHSDRPIQRASSQIPYLVKFSSAWGIYQWSARARTGRPSSVVRLKHSATVSRWHSFQRELTEPRIMQVKDGAAWAALEYSKWAQENPDGAADKPLVIVPCAIVYTNKSKYRSNVRPFGVFIDKHNNNPTCRLIGHHGVSCFHKSRLAHQLTFDLLDSAPQSP